MGPIAARIGIVLLVLLAQGDVSESRDGDHICTRTRIVSPHEFTVATLVALAREFANDECGRCKAAELAVFVGKSDVRNMHKKGEGVTYASWFQEYASMTQPHLPMAQAIAVRSGAVLRISDGTRLLKRVVLRGSDPLLIRADRLDAEIIHVRLFVGSPLASGRTDSRPGAEVFVRTGAPLTEENGEVISGSVASLLGLPFAQVFVRNDVWFIEQAFFPLIYRFEESQPPSFNEYRAARYLECLSEEGETTCWPRQPTK